MDNLETLATLGTSTKNPIKIERKKNKNKKQNKTKNTNDEQQGPQQKLGMNTDACEEKVVPASDKKSLKIPKGGNHNPYI